MEVDRLFYGTPTLGKVADHLKKVAGTDATVLVTGETGTGKKVWAEYIHQHSRRAGRPFHSLNISSLTKELFESEMFGVAKGVYTGQAQTRAGHIRYANGGTLFLDEIGDLSLEVQNKILHLFDRAEVIPVGTTTAIPISVRYIFATKHDLRELIEQGRFREDLYYRILVEHVQLPALRDCPDDIVPLAEHFLKQWSTKLRRRFVLTPEAVERLKAHSWPGNVRELEHAIERAVLICASSQLDASTFQFARNGRHDLTLQEYLTRQRVEYVTRTVGRCGGDVRVAARRLKIPVKTVEVLMGETDEREPI